MLRSKLSSLREYLTPINHNSNFSKTGEISPEEFVKAGDYLVYKFPTWQWSGCPKNLQKSFLPEDKQYLVTKHVPSYQRASNYVGAKADDEEEEEEELEDGWVKSHRVEHLGKQAEINNSGNEIDDIDDLVNDNSDDDTNGLEEDDDLEMISNTNDHLRKYDLYITYSTSYRVPKMYLVGFSSDGIPLLPNQMFEDIQSDYKDKTATMENLPVAYNTTSVSIHPCNHSTVMKVMMKYSKGKKRLEEDSNLPLETSQDVSGALENLTIADETDAIRVDQYLVIFLKFIASVTPGIEYDYTMDAL
ncbi:uncharacterized protein PRCAT00003736001 [Priceomyces carsonii]|uniref:uncharacterized protein n=1 Tax=Priceomyces carsonii TaxID=28549 RepID=UPI002ED7B57A|nr:unnamed protein product [Priceomyces carsonii]